MKNNKQKIICFDECLPPKLADAINLIQTHLNSINSTNILIKHMNSFLGKGTLDEVWIKKLGEMNGIIITIDNNIFKKRVQRFMLIENRIGYFSINTNKNNCNFFEHFKITVNSWENMLNIIENNKLPFAYGFNQKNYKGDKLIKDIEINKIIDSVYTSE